MRRARGAAYWLAPPLLCLWLYRRSLACWFWGDDFAWLSLDLDIHNFHDFLFALFHPAAQGTIRPWSERAFFMAGYALFGLDPLPFHILAFATHFVNLALAAWIGARLTGSRAAGFLAAVLWAISGALIFPLGWASGYNQPMCGFFLLLAFYFLLRYVETGRTRYNVWQWVVFLLGFGALELNLVYPAIAAGFTFLCARKYFRGTLPLFIVSIVYFVLHHAAAPIPTTGVYAMHFTSAMLGVLGQYWTWSIVPGFRWTFSGGADWASAAAVAGITAALLAFVIWRLRAKSLAALFCLLWFVAILAPVLPLRDHLTDYYVYLPLAGLCWLAGWASVSAWNSGLAAKGLAVALVAAYAVLNVPFATAGSRWSHDVSGRVRTLVEGVAAAHQLHPGKSILLSGIDGDLFWSAIVHHPFRLIEVDHVYLAPESEARIPVRPGTGNVSAFVLPGAITVRGLDRDELVVYDVTGPRLKNITTIYAAHPPEAKPPLHVDLASPSLDYLLGPGWWKNDGDHRWMARRAVLRMGAPTGPDRKLYLAGACNSKELESGPLTVTVTVNGVKLPPLAIHRGEENFELAFPLPSSASAQPEMEVAVEVDHTFRPPGEDRDLGLAFGTFEVR